MLKTCFDLCLLIYNVYHCDRTHKRLQSVLFYAMILVSHTSDTKIDELTSVHGHLFVFGFFTDQIIIKTVVIGIILLLLTLLTLKVILLKN